MFHELKSELRKNVFDCEVIALFNCKLTLTFAARIPSCFLLVILSKHVIQMLPCPHMKEQTKEIYIYIYIYISMGLGKIEKG